MGNDTGEVNDGDISFQFNADIPPAIPEGEYEVSFLRAERAFLWKREKVFLHFVVQSLGEWNGTKLFMVCNIASKGRWGASSKYWRMWALAAGRRPIRLDRMSTKVFRNKLFLAQVRTVKTTSTQVTRSPETQYSVIHELIVKIVGT
jgi:hypothetical protein